MKSGDVPFARLSTLRELQNTSSQVKEGAHFTYIALC